MVAGAGGDAGHGGPLPELRFGADFFALQLDFAHRAAAVTGRPLGDALLDCTNIYRRLGLGRAHDPAHPGWRAYLAGLAAAPDPARWTHDCAMAAPTAASPGEIARSGCFSCERMPDGVAHLHFANRETGEVSPLAPARRDARRAELARLVAEVARRHPDTPRIAGFSWLYQLEAYRCLFPPAYIASARPVAGRFRHMPLWGQFLTHAGALRAGPVAVFRANLAGVSLAGAATLESLAACFPLQPLAVSAPLAAFRSGLPGER